MIRNQLYTFVDPIWYELPRWPLGEESFEIARRKTPPGWRRVDGDLWLEFHPLDRPMPEQGWKVHVSACRDNAERVLREVWDYCVPRRIAFKTLPDRRTMFALNSKQAPRQSSGKLATLYPVDVTELQKLLEELSEVLAGEPGPYILSDLRWGQGPLYVRYGAFTRRHCLAADGELVEALARPDGLLVPDRRQPSFVLPPWVEVPPFLAGHLAARRATAGNFPYRVEKALHFSNGGGIYRGIRESDGLRVVLKEARPYAGWDDDGRDAVARLRHEAWALERLAGIPGIPGLRDRFTAAGHEFLAMDNVPGTALYTWMALRYPYINPEPGDDDLDRYRDEAMAVMERVEELVAAVHDAGLVYGDLHPYNVMVDEDGRVGLVDFELAADASDAGYRPPLGFPGFAPARPKTGLAVDRHALAILRSWLFMPITFMLAIRPARITTYLARAEERFRLPAGYGEQITRELAATENDHEEPSWAHRRREEVYGVPLEVSLDADHPDWPAIRRSMADAIELSATPDRRDRLFPGDVEQFVHDGPNLAYGAAGTLWALSVAAGRRVPRLEEWLLDAVARGLPGRPGFWDGMHGIAYVLDHLGHRGTALELLGRALPLTGSVHGATLFNGLAGIGLNLLHFAGATGDAALADEAGEVASRLHRALERGELQGVDMPAHLAGSATAGPAQEPDAGLLRGWSGVALFFVRLYERSGDPAHLDAAVRAIHRDLALCHVRDDGTLQVDGGTRSMPYVENGSAGIALAADQVLRHREDELIADRLPSLLRACWSEHVVEPPLFRGRAGLAAALARVPGTHPRSLEVSRRHLRLLSWHALSFKGHLAFPRYFRLAMDLAHGTAGVLLCVSAAVDPDVPFLPFLEGSATAPHGTTETEGR